MSGEVEKSGLVVSVSNLVQKHRIAIFIILGGLILAAAGLGIYTEVSKNFASNDVLRVENLNKKMQEWASTTDEKVKTTLAADIESTIKTQGESLSYSYAKAQFYTTSAQYWLENKNLKEAQMAFNNVVKETPDSYLAPVALVNLIQIDEQLGDPSAALSDANLFLEKYKSNLILAPQVAFTKARLLDQSGKKDEAIAAFQALIDGFPGEDWTNLAHTRIIQLKK